MSKAEFSVLCELIDENPLIMAFEVIREEFGDIREK